MVVETPFMDPALMMCSKLAKPGSYRKGMPFSMAAMAVTICVAVPATIFSMAVPEMMC